MREAGLWAQGKLWPGSDGEHLETGVSDLSREDTHQCWDFKSQIAEPGRERKENSVCMSNVTFTGANHSSKRGATAGSAGRDALGTGSITRGSSCCPLPAVPAGMWRIFYTSKQTACSSVKKTKPTLRTPLCSDCDWLKIPVLLTRFYRDFPYPKGPRTSSRYHHLNCGCRFSLSTI